MKIKIINIIFLLFFLLLTIYFLNNLNLIGPKLKHSKLECNQNSEIALHSKLKSKQIFESIFENYDDIKFYIDHNMFGLIKGFEFLKNQLINDNRVYKYKKQITPELKINCSLTHILYSIKNVDNFFIPDKDKQKLRMIMFFHDLGKALGEPHEEFSKIITKNILVKLKFAPKEIKFITKIVLLHNEFGRYPYKKYKKIVDNLNKEEIYFLYFTCLADESKRKNFDSPLRNEMLYKIYQIFDSKNENKKQALTSKLNYIHYILKSFFKSITILNPDSYYRLKEFFFIFDDINKISKIKFAV